MIVRLTTGREASMLAAVEHDEEIHAVLTRDRRVEGLRVDVNAPFAAWLFAREALLDRAFNDRGYRNKGVPSTVGGAVRTITQAIGFVSRHPALRGMGTIGHHAVVFPRLAPVGHLNGLHPIPAARRRVPRLGVRGAQADLAFRCRKVEDHHLGAVRCGPRRRLARRGGGSSAPLA